MNLEWIHKINELMMFENMLLMNWYDEYGIDDESCCWCWIDLKVWWNFELRHNDVWFMSFEHSCVCVNVHDL